MNLTLLDFRAKFEDPAGQRDTGTGQTSRSGGEQ